MQPNIIISPRSRRHNWKLNAVKNQSSPNSSAIVMKRFVGGDEKIAWYECQRECNMTFTEHAHSVWLTITLFRRQTNDLQPGESFDLCNIKDGINEIAAGGDSGSRFISF